MRTKKTIHSGEQWKREIEKEVIKFSQPLMSNSKWIRLIDTLVDNNETVQKIFFKKIQHENMGELYIADHPSYGFEYWHAGFELNNSFGEPLQFNEIEFLSFPRVIDSSSYQDLEKISIIIQNIGEFCLESDENELKLICYRK